MQDPDPASERAKLLFSDRGSRRGKATRRAEFPALPPRLQRGERLGDFIVLDEISSGSHSAVFMAETGLRGRPVALKVLSAHLSVLPGAVCRFRAEVALADRVSHPSILPVHGAGSDRGHQFYAMRLESGATLENCASEAMLRRDEGFFCDIACRFASLARAVQFIHDSGIVHRDIKPSNILIDCEGLFVLTDFGSALDSGDRDQTLEECLGGTVLYMSPEQLSPEANPYEISGDIYSLGMTLYEICAGVPPFPRVSDSELARLKVTRIPPPPRRLNHHVPLALESIIRQAIEIKPQLRYASALEMADDLERFACRKRGSSRTGGRPGDFGVQP